MIAVDSSTWIAYFGGEAGEDVDLLEAAWLNRQVLMAPAVLETSCGSSRHALRASPHRDRTRLLATGRRTARQGTCEKPREAPLGDALIAQSRIDGGIRLLTRDRDFRAFADAAGLRLVVG